MNIWRQESQVFHEVGWRAYDDVQLISIVFLSGNMPENATLFQPAYTAYELRFMLQSFEQSPPAARFIGGT
jgi:hypothetical protein